MNGDPILVRPGSETGIRRYDLPGGQRGLESALKDLRELYESLPDVVTKAKFYSAMERLSCLLEFATENEIGWKERVEQDSDLPATNY